MKITKKQKRDLLIEYASAVKLEKLISKYGITRQRIDQIARDAGIIRRRVNKKYYCYECTRLISFSKVVFTSYKKNRVVSCRECCDKRKIKRKEKVCSWCKVKSNRSRYGLFCEKCYRKYRWDTDEKYRESHKKYTENWRQKNREHNLQKMREYNAKNKKIKKDK